MSSSDRTSDSMQFHRDGNRVSDDVLDAVATTLDTDSLELPPLQYSVDVDALDTIWAPTETQNGVTELTFRYAECRVVVDSGHVTVTPLVD